MGFTIGSSRGNARKRGLLLGGRSSECTAVAEFTGLWGWDVVPGARAAAGACSCGKAGCPTPGAHPLDFAPVLEAGATLDEVSETWGEFPGAAVMLPVGRAFDVIEVAEAAGRRALVRLERMGLPTGPVTATPDGRAHFLVAPAPRPSSPSCSTGWAGRRLPRPARPRPRYVRHRPALRPRRPRSGPLAALPRPGLGDEAAAGTVAAGDAGIRGAPVARVTTPTYTAKRPPPNCTSGRTLPEPPTNFGRWGSLSDKGVNERLRLERRQIVPLRPDPPA